MSILDIDENIKNVDKTRGVLRGDFLASFDEDIYSFLESCKEFTLMDEHNRLSAFKRNKVLRSFGNLWGLPESLIHSCTAEYYQTPFTDIKLTGCLLKKINRYISQWISEHNLNEYLHIINTHYIQIGEDVYSGLRVIVESELIYGYFRILDIVPVLLDNNKYQLSIEILVKH